MGCLCNPNKKSNTHKPTKLIETDDKIVTSRGQGDAFKEKGNTYFKNKKYKKAIDMYSKAINTENKVSIYFSNRGRCYKLQKKWDLAIEDGKEAIKLDPNNIKACVIWGECLINKGREYKELRCITEGIDQLQIGKGKCLDKKSPNTHFINYINSVISLAKKLLSRKELENEIVEIDQFMDTMNKLIDSDQLDISLEAKIDYKSMFEGQVSERRLEMVNKSRIRSTMPEYLVCSITQDFMVEPVITNSGSTYENSAIKEHIKKVGTFDPLSRKELKMADLTPNRAIKQALVHFSENNPWAIDPIFGNYEDAYDKEY